MLFLYDFFYQSRAFSMYRLRCCALTHAQHVHMRKRPHAHMRMHTRAHSQACTRRSAHVFHSRSLIVAGGMFTYANFGLHFIAAQLGSPSTTLPHTPTQPPRPIPLTA